MKNMQKIGIYWDDIHAYGGGGVHNPSKVYTEGILAEENSEYILIKNPESIIISLNKIKNHPKYPEKKVLFCYIPKELITDITYYDKSTK